MVLECDEFDARVKVRSILSGDAFINGNFKDDVLWNNAVKMLGADEDKLFSRNFS